MFEGAEFIYILTNRSLPGLVKIGRTDRSVAERVRELSAHTGVPTEFIIFREFRVLDSVAVERAVHNRLKEYRLSESREFFSLEPETAAEVIEELVGGGATQRYDPEAEDELLARATEVIARNSKVWPSLLASSLAITHSEAERLITMLQGRGTVDDLGRSTLVTNYSRRTSSSPSISDSAETQTSAAAITDDRGYEFPPLGLLEEAVWNQAIDEDEHRQNAETLLHMFAEHDLEVCLGQIHVGPIFTRHEFSPNAAFRLERLPAIEATVISQLKAKGARVLSLMPGKQAIGVELPNKMPQRVPLRSIFESEDWCNERRVLPVVLGKFLAGQPAIRDLAKSPPILITGAIGVGRGTLINAVLVSILYSQSPKTARLLIIDPSAEKLSVFNTLPHLLVPVISDPAKVPAAVQWLISEMEMRFQIFAQVGVRGLLEFNNRVRATDDSEVYDIEMPDVMPHIVVILNELADPVIAAPTVLGDLISRLAQYGAAAGIHLIAATQRPAPNVLTEKIQEAFPVRISLKVESQLDSRTVLGVRGAEALIGYGDMLIGSTRSQEIQRAQSAVVSTEEITAVCEFLKRNGPPQWVSSIQRFIDRQSDDAGDNRDNNGDDSTADCEEEDELFYQALEVLKSTRRASPTMLQRRLRIGYNRASRILDIMWMKGMVGPENGDGPRDILVDLDTF